MTSIDATETAWEPLAPAEVGEPLKDVGARWWIAGGWAIDLFLGRQTRPHGDTDIEIARHDLPIIAGALENWDLRLASNGRLYRWEPEDDVPEAVHSLWGRSSASDAWQLQIMLADIEAGRWRYRRDTRIELPIDELGWTTSAGIPVLQPQVQLLYKSRHRRSRDVGDFNLTLEHLSRAQTSWLLAALETVNPGDNWVDALRGL